MIAVPLPPVPTRPAVVHPTPEPPVRLGRLVLALVLSVVAFDLCFWQIENPPGFALGAYFAALASLIVLARERGRFSHSSRIIGLLLVGAVWAAAIETGTTNTFVLLSLIVMWAGNTYYSGITLIWGRWLSQIYALLCAPGRIFWLAARSMDVLFGGGLGRIGRVVSLAFLAIPALVLALIFGALLASGNAVFGEWTNKFFDWVLKEIESYLNFGRIVLWLAAGLIVLPLLRPAQDRESRWKWLLNLPTTPELIPASGAFFSSALILVVLNLLFLVSNVADAMFLWSGHSLPQGVPYKTYVHEGVNALIVTVILSAVVLTAIFQQAPSVARRRELKLLSYAWIVQNLILMISVAEKLRRYIVAYELTIARLSVLIFLLLVATGFVLLAIKIARNRSLIWLIGSSLVAVFVTFYVTQFLDLKGWAANYNVACWEKDRTKQLDYWLLYNYGPDAWPALRKVHDLDPTVGILNIDEKSGPVTTDSVNQIKFDADHWRDFSLRAWWNRSALESP